MEKTSVRKLALASMLTAVAVVGSTLSFPVLGSRCAPVQHMVNILCAVLLGPWYGLGVARFPGKYVRSASLRAWLQNDKEYPRYSAVRNLRNRYSGWVAVLSDCDCLYGKNSRRYRFLCLCGTVSDFYGGRQSSRRSSRAGTSEKRGAAQNSGGTVNSRQSVSLIAFSGETEA